MKNYCWPTPSLPHFTTSAHRFSHTHNFVHPKFDQIRQEITQNTLECSFCFFVFFFQLSNEEFRAPFHIDRQTILIFLQPTLAVPTGQAIECRFFLVLQHWSNFRNRKLWINVFSLLLFPLNSFLTERNYWRVTFCLSFFFCTAENPRP